MSKNPIPVIRTIISSIKNMFVYSKNLVTENAQYKIDNAALLAENVRLKEHKAEPLTFRDGIYYDKNDELFCVHCYDKDKSRFHLLDKSNSGRSLSLFCPECKTEHNRHF